MMMINERFKKDKYTCYWTCHTVKQNEIIPSYKRTHEVALSKFGKNIHIHTRRQIYTLTQMMNINHILLNTSSLTQKFNSQFTHAHIQTQCTQTLHYYTTLHYTTQTRTHTHIIYTSTAPYIHAYIHTQTQHGQHIIKEKAYHRANRFEW